ncbi:MAG: HU family DNA-binding protein [Patescibacteria group bacterium]
MNKAELIDVLAQKTNVSKKEVGDVVENMVQTIMDTLKGGGHVTLTGFGEFSARTRAGREGINPRTKEKITIPPVTVAKFKAGKALKDLLKKQ